MSFQRLACTLVVLLLAMPIPAWAGNPMRCLTYEERSLGRWQTIRDDGTRAVSTYNKTLERWKSTATPPKMAMTSFTKEKPTREGRSRQGGNDEREW